MHQPSHQTHQHGQQTSFKVLCLAIALTFTFAIVEAVGGWWANSLALLGDAGHMGSDAIALGIAAIAAWIAQKPPSLLHSYGLGRAEIIAAGISSLLMLMISVAVIVEAIDRIHTPLHVKGGVVMLIAFIGMLVNMIIAWLLTSGERTLNIRAALLHVLSDMLGSFAALVAGAVIYYTGWLPIDPILSILIGILILISSLRLLRETLLVLMEGVPKHISLDQVATAMQAIQHVEAIHDLHVWTLSSGHIALSAHININSLGVWEQVLKQSQDLLSSNFGIQHITLQPEPTIIDCKPCNKHALKL